MINSSATRDELIALARRLLAAEGEGESAQLYEEFNSHFSHPDLANLFYWPENYDHRRDEPKISDYEPTPEEIVDIGIDHKPDIIHL
ncbi:MAG: colicin immunity protein [Candidatus Competibacterales bacterium]